MLDTSTGFTVIVNLSLTVILYYEYLFLPFRVLQACKRLRLFDVSFCKNVDGIPELEKQYPKVTFKNSFQ